MAGAHGDDEILLIQKLPVKARRDVVRGQDRDIHHGRLRHREDRRHARSTDGGESWTKLARAFGEVRSTIWQAL